jgi:hypothetical protein
MVGEDATGLVGVITIDLADFEPATDASLGCGGHDDATLAQALVRLAARDPVVCAESAPRALATGHPRLFRVQLTGRLTAYWATPVKVTANLGGLAAELEQAVSQVLRRIAASR